MIPMAGRVNDATKTRILEEISRKEKSTAQIAREFGVSPTTIRRIALSNGGRANSKTQVSSVRSPQAASEESLPNRAENPSIKPPETNVIERIAEILNKIQGQKDEGGPSVDHDQLAAEFLKWLNTRDNNEKAKIQMETEIEELKALKGDLEKQVSDLFTRAARVEAMIGRIRAQAENALEALDIAEMKLASLENRLSAEREVLVVASGLKWVLDDGEISDEAMTFISRFKKLWYPGKDEIRRKLRDQIIMEMENSLAKLKQSSQT